MTPTAEADVTDSTPTVEQDSGNPATDSKLDMIPVADIQVRSGFNPRHYFDPDELANLTQSVRDNGVVQPIVVRPSHTSETPYELVAGERRCRAANEAGLSHIPAYVQSLSDEDALAVANAENAERADLSVAEEAWLARRTIATCDSDRDEAARMLGWKRSRLDRRMLLTHATDEVLDALSRRQITVGVAELLSGTPPENQSNALKKIVDRGMTTDQVRDAMKELSREIAHAPFDTTECQTCPYNSSTQMGLFDFTVGHGRCSYHACWDKKTQDYIESVREQCREEAPAVYLDSERTRDTLTILQKDGENGVGPKQYEACQNCQDFGTLICTEPGKEGKTRSGICFNLQCNAEKIKANKAAQQADQGKAQPSSQSDSGAGQTSESTEQAVEQTTGRQSTSAESGQSNEGQAQPDKQDKGAAKLPKKVTEYMDGVIRQQAKAVQVKNPVITDAIHVLGLFGMSDSKSAVAIKVYGYFMGLEESDHPESLMLFDPNKLLEQLIGSEPKALQDARHYLASDLFISGPISQFNFEKAIGINKLDWLELSKIVVRYFQPDLSECFKLDRDFLEAHTKSGINALMRESGFDQWYDDKYGKKAYSKLSKAKRNELIDAILGESADQIDNGFDFNGFVPAALYDHAGIDQPATV